MADDFNATPDAWRVSFSRDEFGRVVRLHVGGTTIILPALDAHKLGSALQAASGLNQEPADLDALASAVMTKAEPDPDLGEVELAEDDIIVICGIPYRVSTLNLLTEDGSLPSVVLHHVGETQPPGQE